MKLIFISDLHLSSDTPKHNDIFYKLLDEWRGRIDGLYILGDFFDHWLGDDDINPFILEIKHRFKAFTQHTPIYFIHGNHDFGLGKQFAKETGITYLRDCTILKVLDKKILLSHGDIFCSLDIGYQRMKKILRNPFLMWVLRQTPLKWRKMLKEKLQSKSSQQFNTKPKHTYHVVDETIVKIALAQDANIVINGHTHNPGRYVLTTPKGEINRYEIPDWEDHLPGGYIMFEDGHISIKN